MVIYILFFTEFYKELGVEWKCLVCLYSTNGRDTKRESGCVRLFWSAAKSVNTSSFAWYM